LRPKVDPTVFDSGRVLDWQHRRRTDEYSVSLLAAVSNTLRALDMTVINYGAQQALAEKYVQADD
jgi:hypothetical protein